MTRFCLGLVFLGLSLTAQAAEPTPAGTTRATTADAAPTSQAIQFEVINRTHLTIATLQLTPLPFDAASGHRASLPDEGARIVTHGEIAPDATKTVQLPPGPACQYSIVLIFVTNGRRQVGPFDLCAALPVVLLPLPSDPAEAEPPPDVGSVPAGSPSPQATQARVGVAALLARGTTPASPDRVYGVLLLQRDNPRNLLVCQRFFDEFVAVRDVMLSPGAAIRRPTYWPDSRKTAALPGRTNCADLVSHYDWETAGGQLTIHGLLRGSGPYLVIYGPCDPAAGSGQLRTAQLDLSGYPDSELDRAFRIWADILTGDPQYWCGTAAIREPRESVRNFLLTYSSVLTSFLISPAEAEDHGLVPTAKSPGGAVAIDHQEIRFNQ